MRKYFFLFLAVVVFAAISVLSALPRQIHAQHGMSGRNSNVFITHDYEEVTSTTGVVKTITSGIINATGIEKTQRAYITFTGQAIRFICDGTTPTTSLGIPVPAGGSIELVGLLDIQNFKFINDDDTGTAYAHISLQYEKEMN